jgi:hypothetical protein
MLGDKIFSHFKGKKTKKVESKLDLRGDILELILKDREYFASLESVATQKPISEVLQELNLGLKVHSSGLEKKFQILGHKSLIVIPPKYEFWTYFLIALNLAQLGYSTKFLFHNWSKSLVEVIKPNMNYLKYQNLSFDNLEDYDFLRTSSSKILNFSESVRGIPNTIPSFSTALICGSTDLDYVIAYIFKSTFSFAGLKKSSLKRIIVDENIKKEFFERMMNRLVAVDIKNASKIRSEKLRQQIHELVSDGISEGADLIMGSGEFDNDAYSNVILNEVDKDFRIYQKKFYGPVLQLAYTNFSDKELLKKFIQQQPSRGIVVFSDSNDLIEKELDSLSGKFSFVSRPLPEENEFAPIIENHPSIEILLKFIEEDKL